MTMVPDFEKLGVFYLGKEFDAETGKTTDDLLLYDAKDLTTHAVCVGMTGSGKTGLCVGLIEEALIDNIPVIAIDPKGDLGNLLLTFPELRPEDFAPWIDADEATRNGSTPAEWAVKTADLWRSGLEKWGQNGERIRHLKGNADFAIYTPGASAGLGLSILKSFAAPSQAVLDDADSLRDRIMAAVSGLLTLVGVDADPVRSREHILLSNILERAWREGRDVDLAELIQAVQKPSFDKIGVLSLESFFPSGDRFALAMTLNNLLASPSFAGWMEGEGLDIQRLLWTAEGKPRLSILSIAHLSDAERMFFVTLLLNEVLSWVRAQPGTSSLRAILYMDEVFGYFPPTANPPSKKPMLTLLKQARAFGLGIVLATQNPVDLDYKGLSNAGTWLIGRLQTEQDKARVLDGLEGASAAAGMKFERGEMERIISGLGKRVFLMNNVHEDAPVLMQTRWALSYLRGPLTRGHIQSLMAERKKSAGYPAAGAGITRAAAHAAAPVSRPPVLPAEIPQVFIAPAQAPAAAITYAPGLLATARIHYVDARKGIDHWEEVAALAPLDAQNFDPWTAAEYYSSRDVRTEPGERPGAHFEELPAAATNLKQYKSWEKLCEEAIYRDRRLSLMACPPLKLAARPGESAGEFRVRLREAANELRDIEVEKLRRSYATKINSLQNKMRTAEEKVAREKSQHDQQKLQTVISFGSSMLGALLSGGKRRSSYGLTTAARGLGRQSREKDDVRRSQAALVDLQRQMADLEAECNDEIAEISARINVDSLPIEETNVAPRKSDISVLSVRLAWIPRG